MINTYTYWYKKYKDKTQSKDFNRQTNKKKQKQELLLNPPKKYKKKKERSS